MCKKCVCVQENLHWLIASSQGRFISEILLLHRICGGETLRTQCEFIWSLWVTNVNGYFGYLIIFWYPWARNGCACMWGAYTSLVYIWKWVLVTPFPPHTTCDCESAKNSFKDWTWYVWTQWTVGGGLVWFLHNHLKWLNEATQVIYSFKKYICLINTSPGTLQVSWLSLSSPLGLVVSWQQQDGSLGLTLGLTFATRLREVWTACTGRWAKHFSLTGSLTWGERCSHGALHAA